MSNQTWARSMSVISDNNVQRHYDATASSLPCIPQPQTVRWRSNPSLSAMLASRHSTCVVTCKGLAVGQATPAMSRKCSNVLGIGVLLRSRFVITLYMFFGDGSISNYPETVRCRLHGMGSGGGTVVAVRKRRLSACGGYLRKWRTCVAVREGA